MGNTEEKVEMPKWMILPEGLQFTPRDSLLTVLDEMKITKQEALKVLYFADCMVNINDC